MASKLAAAAVACLILAVNPTPGMAATVACDYSGSDHKAKITMPSGSIAEVKRSIDDRIRVNGIWCGRAATVFNTDRIVILGGAGTQSVILRLDYGGFKPGFTDEAGSSDEIELSVSLGGGGDSIYVSGSGAADHMTAGKSTGFAVQVGLNLNAAESSGVDSDLTLIVGVEEIVVQGNADNDVISGAGGAGTGAPADFRLKISGNAGNDELTGGAAGDSIIDDQGVDVVKGGAGADFMSVADDAPGDQIFGGNGVDMCEADPGDVLTSC